MTYTETDLVASMERLAGERIGDLQQQQWDRLDQFHSGGAEAVDRLVPGLRLTTGMTVLDVGSGFGGPARQVARNTGCAVVGVDITPAYVEAAVALTDIAGLSQQVSFFCSDITTFDQADFDAAYTMHVQMNVADKSKFFTSIAHRLLPGARFATFEVCLRGDTEPTTPLPWSLDGSDSFLIPAATLRDTIQFSGFELVEWIDETAWVREWFENVAVRAAVGGSQASLPALLNDGPARMKNLAVALAEGLLTVHRGSFVLAP
ncbi:MAG TPA: methyltransferase domain-containing protein [Acidothermaceae bacterium]|jgi:sarcosine/dimethylglycine N-methyltransferase|nr:methyltransferase domain-containing protein [Acidothermaceae bacterium]